ncbi:hypothetical protein HN695_07930 [Candidatus Woesearchaeota archaeon]|jgi:pyruvate, water dikinase|nr:hypothetical protein [Candidatus Woesearchaeota archaeon]MBT5272470.1 hypothetical protein [Candidatus Woesearchaeota archaeon]MBT6041522.1 hypothetical protein [Candidatus Woesearchaeota archaeon]MBT6336332.1 hypothetical protein [Candidatus Woesearchaeota archaeon]MBT7928234.1 hypothetical protein [Candidatus Woesearchaeota archaeon]
MEQDLLGNEIRERVSVRDPSAHEPFVTGRYISDKVAQGKALIVPDEDKYNTIDPSSIVVLRKADITWFPLINQAAGVIVEEGTISGHFSQMLREMNKPAVYAAHDAKKLIKQDQEITICPGEITMGPAVGYVINGAVELKVTKESLPEFETPKTKVFAISSFVGGLKQILHAPVAGVGVMRSDFLNNSVFGVHPSALLDYSRGLLESRDPDANKNLDKLLSESFGFSSSRAGYTARDLYVNVMAKKIADVAKLLPGKRINYRLCDLRSDDSKRLLGGDTYELREDNPAQGKRGAYRLLKERETLYLECDIIKKAMEISGADINIFIPFCRTPFEVEKLVGLINDYGLTAPEIGGMVEVSGMPYIIDEFTDTLDFFVFGPFDMTQGLFMMDREYAFASDYAHPNNRATIGAFKLMLKNLQGFGKDVYLPTSDLFHLEEYMPLLGDTKLHLACFPDTFERDVLFTNKKELECGYK